MRRSATGNENPVMPPLAVIQGGKMNRSILSTLSLVTVLTFTLNAQGAEPKDKIQKKTVTVINAESSADGSTQIGREAIKECIVTLPKADALDPEVTADSRFLKEINGETTKNDWVRIYTAKLTINYMVYRKDMLIVATKTIEGKDPVLKELEKRLPMSQVFVSNPANGDTFAGRSNRQYYFTKQDEVVKDVRAQALVWLKEQAPLLCTDTK
jgi:hypothetical protein